MMSDKDDPVLECLELYHGIVDTQELATLVERAIAMQKAQANLIDLINAGHVYAASNTFDEALAALDEVKKG